MHARVIYDSSVIHGCWFVRCWTDGLLGRRWRRRWRSSSSYECGVIPLRVALLFSPPLFLTWGLSPYKNRGQGHLRGRGLSRHLFTLWVGGFADRCGIVLLYGFQTWYTETANKDGMWLREISSCCCLTRAGKTRQLLLNKMYIPFLTSLYVQFIIP